MLVLHYGNTAETGDMNGPNLSDQQMMSNLNGILLTV